jgi:hypothetical protein
LISVGFLRNVFFITRTGTLNTSASALAQKAKPFEPWADDWTSRVDETRKITMAPSKFATAFELELKLVDHLVDVDGEEHNYIKLRRYRVFLALLAVEGTCDEQQST